MTTMIEMQWQNCAVIPYTIRPTWKVWHRKHARFVGQIGVVVKQAKCGHLLVKFDGHKNLIGIPASCLTLVRNPTNSSFY